MLSPSASSTHYTFHNLISSTQFPAEKDRYVLYVNYCCPYSQQNIVVLHLKGLQDIVQVVEVDDFDRDHGWHFSGIRGPSYDPINGVRKLKDLYTKTNPQYNGRCLLPLLWDKQQGLAVNNSSADINRMFFSYFDHLLPLERRETSKGLAAFRPSHLQTEIDNFNSWMHALVDCSIYGVSHATTDANYSEQMGKLIRGLDLIEHHLSQPSHYPYLFGEHITDADIRLYPTIFRFDLVYYRFWRCNLKMIRVDYPRIQNWLTRVYWSECPETRARVFKDTTLEDEIRRITAKYAPELCSVPQLQSTP